MYTKERQKKILDLLEEKKSVSVNDLTSELNFSPATIRSDLNYLNEQGLLIRTHGGATVVEKTQSSAVIEENFLRRTKKNKDKKVQIAKKAIELIEDSNCIILDASSTAYELAHEINQSSLRLTILTNGIRVANFLKNNQNLTVILIGGVIKGNTNAIEGLLGIEIFDKLNIDLAFLSANAFNITNGLTDFNLYEVELKKKMVEKAKCIYALIDDSKLEKSSIATFANVNDVDAYITNKSVNSYIIDKYKKESLNFIISED